MKKDRTTEEVQDIFDDDFFKISPEEEKYCDEWNSYFESKRNLELEKKINNNELRVKVYFNRNSFKICSKDFEISYHNDESFDCLYNHSALRKLFEKGFKFIELEKACDFYKICEEVRNHLIDSSFREYKTRNKVFILVKDDDLYCICGRAYLPKNINKEFYGYVGRVGGRTFTQKSIFDYEGV